MPKYRPLRRCRERVMCVKTARVGIDVVSSKRYARATRRRCGEANERSGKIMRQLEWDCLARARGVVCRVFAQQRRAVRARLLQRPKRVDLTELLDRYGRFQLDPFLVSRDASKSIQNEIFEKGKMGIKHELA
ncbi:unnamed protein product [Lampetra planeri]